MFWLIALLTFLLALLYFWIKQKYSYFDKNGVPYIPPIPLIGNLKSMLFLEKSPIQTFHSFYEHKNAENQPFVGIYLLHKPGLVIRDLELIKRILIKDFNYFSNRGGSPDPHIDAIGAYNLFFVKNPKWKSIRAALTSFFSSGKLRNSSLLIQEVGNELDNHLKILLEKKTSDWDGIEFKELSARYTTDVIATVAFGLNANSIKNPNAEFRSHGAKLTKFTWRRSIEFSLVLLFPELAKFFKARVGQELENHLTTLLEKKTADWDGIEFKELSARYTTDVIATVAFGLHANSIKNPKAEFRTHGAKLVNFTWKRNIEATLILLFPTLAKYYKARLFTAESNHFLRSSIGYAMNEREKSKVKRNDLIDILLELKNSGKVADENDVKFEGDVLIAQAAFFFLAGFETSSAALTFSLYNLAMNPEIQKRAREDIKEALKKSNGELTYDAISEMEYLSAIIYETTRLYPVVPFLDRECTPPAGESGYSLEPYSDFVIPKGMVVYIPIYSLHMNPKYFNEPDKFDPERFLTKNRGNITANSFLGFGGGPHYCIGERLGILQSKIGLINVLRNHWVQPTKKTPKTLKFNKKSINTQVEGGIYLDIKRDPLF